MIYPANEARAFNASASETEAQSRRAKLRNALRNWRARLKPEDIGIVSIGKRRVPGLRRAEVADLAEISVEWYTMLETARHIRVSPRLLDRLAAVLRLNDREKLELFSLAMDEFTFLTSAAQL